MNTIRFIFFQALILAVAGMVLLFSAYGAVRIVGGILLVGGFVGIFVSRSVVGEFGAAVSAAWKRLTQQAGGGEAKAYLEAIEGFDLGGRTRFEIYGETTIGRSRDYAALVFDSSRAQSPIGRLHCTIHEEELTGSWTIEDEDTLNGTWLNGVRLKPLERVPLNDGDNIELAPVERGGIKFRFELLSAAREMPIPVPGSEPTG